MLTLAHIFYDQHCMLRLHQTAWDRHPADGILYTLIDDASTTPVSKEFGRRNLSVYRVEEDIPWNIAGARNLAFHTAKTDWVLCADADHVVTAAALAAIERLDLSDPNIAYTFRRRTQDGFVGVDAIINILMNRRRFFEVGGYDEDYSGHYGREETFFIHCLRQHRVVQVRCDDIFLEWYPKLGRTWRLCRDKSHNAALYERKMSELKRREYHNGTLLRFPWKGVDLGVPAGLASVGRIDCSGTGDSSELSGHA